MKIVGSVQNVRPAAQPIEERADRRQPVRAEQRQALADQAEEREHVDEAEQAQDHPARQPVVTRRAEPSEDGFPWRRNANVVVGVLAHT